MVATRTWSHSLAALAMVGMCYAPISVAESVRPPMATQPMVRDVELANGGLLVGRLLDANGKPLAGCDVSVLSGDRTLASTRTDIEGVFAVSGLRGGVHQINSTDTAQVCRLWTHGTAPPHATQSLEVVRGGELVRGQYGPPPGNRMWKKAKVWATNPFVVGGVVAAAIAIPVALSDDDGPHS